MREEPPQRLRMALHALRGGHDEDGVVERRKDALRLGGEIGVSRRVEEEVRRLSPGEVRLSGEDGDAALALDRLGVEEGVAVVDAPALPQRPAEVQQLLGERRLPGVDVRENADGFSHCFFLLKLRMHHAEHLIDTKLLG